jgi:hypothetical protein
LQLFLFGGEGLLAILDRLLAPLGVVVALLNLLVAPVDGLLTRDQPLLVRLDLPPLLLDLLLERFLRL